LISSEKFVGNIEFLLELLLHTFQYPTYFANPLTTLIPITSPHLQIIFVNI